MINTITKEIMDELIYDSRDEARLACTQYEEAVMKLQERFSIWKDQGDTYYHAKYYDEDGKVRVFTYKESSYT